MPNSTKIVALFFFSFCILFTSTAEATPLLDLGNQATNGSSISDNELKENVQTNTPTSISKLRDKLGFIETKMYEYSKIRTWKFWGPVALLMLFCLATCYLFTAVDLFFSNLTGKEYEGSLAYFPLVTAVAGMVLPVVLFLFQLELKPYLASNSLLWPAGFGFAPWILWSICAAVTLVYASMIIQSLFCGNLIHAFIRIIIQTVLAFVTLFIIVIAAMAFLLKAVIAILVVFGILHMTKTTKYVDSDGTVYEE